MSVIDFSIITPSYNMLDYLKLCSASIADQRDVSIEHLVVDGKSADGTAEWLEKQKNIASIIEADRGMYDAINKGLRRATGGIIAYLNCDEQYLPGTLAFVKRYFDEHPAVDVLFGDHFIVSPDGGLISYRKSYTPREKYIIASELYTFTCTMFFRRRVVDEGLLFDPSYKCIADKVFVLELFKRGYAIKHVRRYFSTFTATNSNLSFTEQANFEMIRLNESLHLTFMEQLANPLYKILRIAEKGLRGCYFETLPITYSVYIDSTAERKTIVAEKATPLWRTK